MPKRSRIPKNALSVFYKGKAVGLFELVETELGNGLTAQDGKTYTAKLTPYEAVGNKNGELLASVPADEGLISKSIFIVMGSRIHDWKIVSFIKPIIDSGDRKIEIKKLHELISGTRFKERKREPMSLHAKNLGAPIAAESFWAEMEKFDK